VASKTRNDEADGKIDVEEIISELEHKVERLKILYEQYFMGIEKMEPQTQRKEVTRKMLELSQLNIRNTAMRYRFHALNQKFGSYQTYWGRVQREIENGTYYRSIARASREAARKGQDLPDEVMRALPKRLRDRIEKDRVIIAASARAQKAAAAGAGASGGAVASGRPTPPPVLAEERDDESFEQTFEQLFDSMTSAGAPNPLKPASAKPAKGPPTIPPSGPAAPVKPRPVSLPAGMDEEKVRDLHRRYVAAKQALGDASEVRYEQILSTVAKQGPKILEQHGASAVDFGVVVKDGKVILKATPKR
jgi:putative intracellular protease/amidase